MSIAHYTPMIAGRALEPSSFQQIEEKSHALNVEQCKSKSVTIKEIVTSTQGACAAKPIWENETFSSHRSCGSSHVAGINESQYCVRTDFQSGRPPAVHVGRWQDYAE